RIYAKQNKKESAKADFQLALDLAKTNHLQNGKYPEAQYELDVLEGRIKPKTEVVAPKNAVAEKPVVSIAAFAKIPAPEPFESQFQQAMNSAPNAPNPLLNRQRAFMNFYNAIVKSTLS